MDLVHERCCGWDLHRLTVVACVRLGLTDRFTRTFPTTTEGLLALADWLADGAVTAVAMESTGVYWKPVYNLLEAREFQHLLVVNAQHMKALPGRKTDVQDAEWIAELLQHGLLRASFIPPRATRELRELVRYRTSLVEARTAEIKHIHALLVGADLNTKLVASDLLGGAGRAILAALAAGETDPEVLAALGDGKLRTDRAQRVAGLRGTMGDHQRLVLRAQLAHIDFLNAQLAALSAEITTRLAPYSDQLARLDTIPGVGLTTAEVIVTELGTDMSRFPTAAHAASWAGGESGAERQWR